MIRIEVNIDGHQLLGSLSRLMALGRDATPIMRGLANILRASAQDAFDRERDPVTGARWPPLNTAYKKQRHAGRHTGKMLNRTGDMRRSLSVRYGPDFALAGVNAAYAAAHQFGANTAPHVIRPRGKKALNVPGIGPLARVNHPGSVIPARPFLGVGEAEREEMRELAVRHLTAALRG